MIQPDEFRKKMKVFPHWKNFNHVWEWKINVELDTSAYVLDENHKKETYRRLCTILPRWQTYRNGNNSESLKTLKSSLDNISEEYNKLRSYTLLDFDKIPFEILEKVWHELGRVKEKDGNRNAGGYYSIISISKPLLLMWGQTPAFDSHVRKNMSKSYNIPKYACNWKLNEWIKIMKQLSKNLCADERLLGLMNEESEKRYGKKAIVPYGRFFDILYWKNE